MKTNDTSHEKFQAINALYKFPYHYIPHITEEGDVSLYRFLDWGYEYYCYMLHVKEMVDNYTPSPVLYWILAAVTAFL